MNNFRNPNERYLCFYKSFPSGASLTFDIFCFKEKQVYGSIIPRAKEDIQFIKNNKIEIIISLTHEITQYKNKLQLDKHFKHHEIFIPDGDVPSKRQVELFLRIVEKGLKENKRILVHCIAGCGRTGLMLALVDRFLYENSSVENVISKLRKIRPCAIENNIQKDFVINYSRPNKLEAFIFSLFFSVF
jgi:protein-tyrosine phosphatase